MELSRRAEEKAAEENNFFNAGWNAYDAGLTYYFRNQHDEVLACASRAANYWKDEGVNERSNAIELRGLGLQLVGNYKDAIVAHKEALALQRSIDPEGVGVSVELNWLANAESASGDMLAAERHYNEALRIAGKAKYSDGLAYITGNLAAIAIEREEWDKVLKLAGEALILAERLGRQEEIARESARFALALTHQSRSAEGLPYARRAVEIYMQLRSPGLEWAKEVLAKCEAGVNKKSKNKTPKAK